uniref:Rhodanese domain-containing protein n=1 Tax=Paulinella chromatophora TaxID=39717 RepID=B1X425_PAUCH|nr:hypothetical protein PCC_0245 [Paulinella chromatophora]ACB42694.1 hypothetical protein PCC_0245 [Paulinella chromatophora]
MVDHINKPVTMERCQIKDFLKFETIILDVRSPSEYKQGHIPGALNLPLFNDEEHKAVGTIYKVQGYEAAVQLGLHFVYPKLAQMGKELTIWNKMQVNCQNHKCNYICIYCRRGGMRSASIAWLAEVLGCKIIILEGGYKNFRSWVINQFNIFWPLHLLGGRTGTGKTDLLMALQLRNCSVLNLESLANHRGSSFGGIGLPPQPSTEHYENLLSIHLYNLTKLKEIYLEGESAQIGTCRIPVGLWRQMQKGRVLEIQRPINYRVKQLVMTYGALSQKEMIEATRRISSRLGPQRSKLALNAISEGNAIYACIQMLDYYDHCYDFESERSPQRKSIDLGMMTAKKAARELLQEGLIW